MQKNRVSIQFFLKILENSEKWETSYRKLLPGSKLNNFPYEYITVASYRPGNVNVLLSQFLYLVI